jgi:hypothetical protein
MPETRHDDWSAMWKAVEAWVERHYPDRQARGVIVQLRSGDNIILPAPGHAEQRQEPTQVTGEVADAIRSVLLSADQPMKATSIARKAGRRAAHSHFRLTLRNMVRSGEVVRVDVRVGESGVWDGE